MTIRIGHASKDEHGKTTGGAAGDQTGRELRIQNFYANGWKLVLRAKDPAVAEKLARACEDACSNENIGYDQSGRNTLNTEAKAVGYDLSKITAKCECDCSSLMAVCVRATLERDYYTGNAPTTRTLEKVLLGTGAFEALTDGRYLDQPGELRRGDILLKPGYHTAAVLDDGPEQTSQIHTYSLKLPLLKKGGSGKAVKALQILLIGHGYSCGKYGADGDFGTATENAAECFQEDNDLTVDGQVGGQTWVKLLGINESK